MNIAGQPDEPPGAITIIPVGLSYDRTRTTASAFPIAAESLPAFNTELTLQQNSLRGPQLRNRRADALARERARRRLVSTMAPEGSLVLHMGKTHPQQRVNFVLTWLTSAFVTTERSALVLMNPGQGLTWYHLTPGERPSVRQAQGSAPLPPLPFPEAEARRSWEFARLLATLRHRDLALAGD